MTVYAVDFEIGGGRGLAPVFNSAQHKRHLSEVKTWYSTKIFDTGI
jgi:hypothetical protein